MLSHSVLAPFVSPSQSFVSLSDEDVAAIQSLYSAAPSEPTTAFDHSADTTDGQHDRSIERRR
ncbi:hypothetical protein Poly21_18540 [Allorhodopirellula heiligendammensis]|uniref:Uncharacterized protein n=2 Tax=Allorhodopirellula heiligendammensis TaxID=2714739 RepID=A0A5C6CA77_9BACT|nr:hypothetical protein Poly21_18540 [Allorhodopirellula heiligendammensis]